VEDVDNPVVQQEIFGPVQTFEVFQDEDDAIRRANATEYGLARQIGRPYLEFSGLAYQAATGLNDSLGRALECGSQAIGLAERHGWTDDPAAGVACTTLGSVLTWQGRPEEAEPWVQRAEATLRVEARARGGGGLYIVRGELELARNRDTEALAAFQAAERLARRLGLPLRTVPPSRALLLHALVRLDETEQFLASLIDEDRERGEIRVATAELRLAQGDSHGALAALAPVLAEPSLLSLPNWLPHAYMLKAAIRDALDDEAAAEAALERALDFAEPDGLVTPFLSDAAPGLLERHARRSSHASLLAEIRGALAGATPAPRAGARPLLEALSEWHPPVRAERNLVRVQPVEAYVVAAPRPRPSRRCSTPSPAHFMGPVPARREARTLPNCQPGAAHQLSQRHFRFKRGGNVSTSRSGPFQQRDARAAHGYWAGR